MEDNTIMTAADGTPTPEGGERTFTQDQLNQIVQERLAKEKGKAEAAQAELAQREQDIAHRELLLTAKTKLIEHDLSLDLLEAINLASPEAIETSIAVIKKVINETKAQPAHFRGYVPVESRDKRSGAGGHFDALRQVMGLNREE